MPTEQIVEDRIAWKSNLRQRISDVIREELAEHPSRRNEADRRPDLAAQIDLESVLCNHFGCLSTVANLINDQVWPIRTLPTKPIDPRD